MTVRLPFARPEEPSPAIARPTMNIVEELATPHINEPNSKIIKKNINTHWVEKDKRVSFLGLSVWT